MKLTAQRELRFAGTQTTIPKGGTLTAATPEQIATFRESHPEYDRYTIQFKMVLVDLGNDGLAWVFPSDYQPTDQTKRLSRDQVESQKGVLADKIQALYHHPAAKVIVARTYPGDQYVATVKAPNDHGFTATGTTELRALRALYKSIKNGNE